MDIQTQKKLDYLDETKQLIREAIEEMGQPVTDTDTFRSYAEKIRASKPVLQDKTITENGTYTADEGFDGLGEVTVEVAGSGGGSLVIVRKYLQIAGTYGSRVNVDLGIKPEMILLLAGNNTSVGTSGSFVSLGFNSNYYKVWYKCYVYNNKLANQSGSGSIDSSNTEAAIYNADATGFNIGKALVAGYYYIFAVGLASE